MKSRPVGFTLVELIVSMGIMAILATLILFASNRWIDRGRSVACISNLRNLGVALQSYLGDHQQKMPAIAAGRASKDEDVPVIDTVLLEYAGSAKAFACPADRALAARTGTSYYWNSAMSSQNLLTLNFLNFVQDATKIPLLCDKEGWHVNTEHNVNFLYADGHVAQELSIFTTP